MSTDESRAGELSNVICGDVKQRIDLSINHVTIEKKSSMKL
jgi:hypothetical protein